MARGRATAAGEAAVAAPTEGTQWPLSFLAPLTTTPRLRAERRYGTPGLLSTIVYVYMINDPLLTYTACCKYLREVATLRRAFVKAPSWQGRGSR